MAKFVSAFKQVFLVNYFFFFCIDYVLFVAHSKALAEERRGFTTLICKRQQILCIYEGGVNPALTEAFWKIPSDFAETLNYGQFLLFFFFFSLPFLQDVRNKYFNSKWHRSALQRCGPGPCAQQPPAPFSAVRRAARVWPFSGHSHTRELPKHCRARPSSASRQTALCI